MRVLQLCHKPPVPAVDGGCIAMNKITESLLSQGMEVKVLAMETFKHGVLPERIDPAYMTRTNMETIFVDIKVKWYEALFNLFSKQSYNITRFYDQAFAQKLRSILDTGSYDIVIFESLYTTMYLDLVKKNSGASTIYRAHNLEFRIWEHHFMLEKNALKKAYLKLLHRRLKKYELDVAGRFDGIAAINEEEGAYFSQLYPSGNVEVIPVSIDIKPVDRKKSSETTFFHIGSMDWTPNQDGIQWLLENVWRNIAKDHPAAELHLAGRKMPGWLLQLKQEQVVIHGEVKDALHFMAGYDVMIVPLFSASGVRIKILEAMSLGKTVLCTEVAAKGIPYTKGRNILIADTTEEFSQLIRDILSKKIDLEEIGRNAANLIKKHYDDKQVTRKLVTFFNQALNS